MLPIYKAISFIKIIEKGGRTRPWLVLVDTGGGVIPYVVKMFTTQLIQSRNSVCNEVLGNVLAQEFSLPVPKAALIEMDQSFQSTINDPEAFEIFQQVDERIKFGTEQIEGNFLFSPVLTKRQAARMIELDSLFAFDNLIRNRDRNNAKPNLLVKGNSAYLIDHELGFEIDNQTLAEYNNGIWHDNFYRFHIFYNYLKNSRKLTKISYFEEFREYLNYLNIKGLDPIFNQLSALGYDTRFKSVLEEYLQEMKKNSSNFVNLLKMII